MDLTTVSSCPVHRDQFWIAQKRENIPNSAVLQDKTCSKSENAITITYPEQYMPQRPPVMQIAKPSFSLLNVSGYLCLLCIFQISNAENDSIPIWFHIFIQHLRVIKTPRLRASNYVSTVLWMKCTLASFDCQNHEFFNGCFFPHTRFSSTLFRKQAIKAFLIKYLK